MRHRFLRTLTFCGLAVLGSLSAAKSQVGALTVGSIIQSLEELIKTAEQSAARLIEQGHNALAQQQMLAAGIAKGLVTELRDTYKTSLNITFNQIASAQTNIASDIDKFFNATKGLEKDVATDVQNTIYQMQGAANQILTSLPFTKQDPVIYGLMVHDIFSELPKKGFDIELLGFNFTSATLGHKKPVFAIGDLRIPESSVSIQGDRVQIALPAELKSKVGYSDNFCQPRPNFALKSTVFYSRSNGWIWPFSRQKEHTLDNVSFGLAASEWFVMELKFSGTRSSTMDKTETFQKRSPLITVGCESASPGNLSYALPNSAKEINCEALWVEQQRLKTTTQACAVGGQTVTGTGTISGRDRNCFVTDVLSGGLLRHIVGKHTACNCPGGGQGYFELRGSYKVPETKSEPVKNRDAGTYRFDDQIDTNLPIETTLSVSEIYADIKREKCDQVFDTIKLTLPEDKNLSLKQSSSRGYFDLQYRLGRLLVRQK